ncbi:MAG: DUF4249 family protein [Calditrichaeota bacterium]|nr:DUF4249 family protein [Calditrichota bacterium]
MKKIMLLLTVGFIVLSGCTRENPVIPENDFVVVRAYLYANQPVSDIQITTTFPLDVEIEQAPVVNDASVTISKNGQRYNLVSTSGDNGYYNYPDGDLTVGVGDEFTIEVDYNGKLATGQTLVPPTPDSVSLSSRNLVIPQFNQGSRPDLENAFLTVKWDNTEREFFYLDIENLERDPIPIESSFPGRFKSFISQPVKVDSFRVNFGMVTHYGTHRVIVYRVNSEYADMYEWREQDSRDLNEPLTNISNGLGVFSAFNSDTLYFEVIEG